MRDRLEREIEYLRLSVTQNCNLNCIYCRPSEKEKNDNCCQGLTPQEIEKAVGAMVRLGIKKVRITGGEPLTRIDVCDIISRISGIPQIEDISMTTNGMNLAAQAENLKRAGLRRINISLDSLRSDRFQFITGGGRLENVLEGIGKAVSVGLNPVKINAVLMKGLNDDEVEDFIRLAKDQPLEVRFIELMPVGKFGENNRDKIVFNSDILAGHPMLKPARDRFQSGPATMYELPGYQGRIGFISPMGHRFCASCNRVRLTCDGKLKLCLGDNAEADIVGILRENTENIDEAIHELIYNKPEGHNFNRRFTSNRGMNAIGG